MLYATMPIDFSIMDWDGNRSSSSNSIRNDFSELSGPLVRYFSNFQIDVSKEYVLFYFILGGTEKNITLVWLQLD